MPRISAPEKLRLSQIWGCARFSNLLIVFCKCFSYKAHWSQHDYVTSTSGVSQHLKLIPTQFGSWQCVEFLEQFKKKQLTSYVIWAFRQRRVAKKRPLPRLRWLVDMSHTIIRAIRLETQISMVDRLSQDQRNMALNFQLPHFESCSGTLLYAIPLVNMQGARFYSVHLRCMQVALLAELSWQLGTWILH